MKYSIGLFISILVFVWGHQAHATHNRAGEITYKQVGELTYEITITTYTYTKSLADRDELTVSWGDNTFSVAERYSERYLPDFYKQNQYRARHTFPGPGTYEIVVEDPNRNDGVQNIPNSVQVVFAIKTTLQINPSVGYNNTPILLTEPIDKAALYQVFMHNPSAYDPDGDSISYSLTTCLTENGEPIDNYSLPPASDSIYVNPVTGDLVWDTPVKTGLYNVAIEISEWRNGVRIGAIVRDIQIEVVQSENTPPVFDSINNICIMAGDTAQFTIGASDDDDQEITLTAYGGPFQVESSPASFNQGVKGEGYVEGELEWVTNCSHVRQQPYQITFKAIDDYPEVKLTSFYNVQVKVIGPPPENLATSPTNRTITLTWDASSCDNVIGYNIYRKDNPSDFEPDSCQTGIPDSIGFEKIATVEGRETISFVDDNDETGLWQGVQYCYRVTAVFPDGAESKVSEEVCDVLVRGMPAITNVDVLETSETNGEIALRWAYPTEFDSVAAPGPYMYQIYHSPDFWGKQFQLVDSVMGLKNTEFIHSGINTLKTPHSYMVVFWNNTPGNRFPLGTPQIASSVFLQVFAGVGGQLSLSYKSNVPWTIEDYTVFRKESAAAEWDSLTTTFVDFYTDKGLQNGKDYYYMARSNGFYSIEGAGVPDPILNHSQIRINAPIDTIAPCPPELTVESLCEAKVNQIAWTNPNNTDCAEDVVRYRLYFSDEIDKDMGPIASIEDPNDTTFTHTPEKSLAGCYAVTAIDSFGNETPLSNQVCVDECYYYKLPNVFTPDADGQNDLFIPFPYDFVERIDLKVYNRWGTLVYETEDPDIRWDGTHKDTGQDLPEGIYYYVCDVYEHRLTGLEPRYMVGFVSIFRNQQSDQP